MTRRLAFLLFALTLLAASQSKSAPAGVLGPQDVKDILPASVFFQGQSAPVQMRNSGGVRTAQGKLILAALVDTSGYASNVAEKYQAYLLTEVEIKIEGKALPPGAYGFGFVGDKFNVMDIGGHELLNVSAHMDAELHRPVPLRVAQSGSAYRLYFGKKFVEFAPA